MKFIVLPLALLLMALEGKSQDRYSGSETSVNLFRSPSAGMEYRADQVSIHIGFYPTIVSKNSSGKNESTSFIRVGISYWYAPWGKNELPSSLHSSVSYVRGLTKTYKNQNGVMLETGSRFMIDNHWNFRLGAALLKAPSHKWKLNPTPGFSYSSFSKP